MIVVTEIVPCNSKSYRSVGHMILCGGWGSKSSIKDGPMCKKVS